MNGVKLLSERKYSHILFFEYRPLQHIKIIPTPRFDISHFAELVQVFVMSTHMMNDRVRAFIYIDVKSGKEKGFLEKLMKHDEVIEAHIITGQYDVLAVLEFGLLGKGLPIYSSVYEMISKFVIEKIRKIRDVQDTNTVIPAYSLTKR
jgi:DNA-binding Lrp family transcriptional regulator